MIPLAIVSKRTLLYWCCNVTYERIERIVHLSNVVHLSI